MATKSIYNLLNAEMRAKVAWESNKLPPFPAVDSTVSGQVWSTIPGGHKWLSYFQTYDREFGAYHGKSPRVLEIGVYRGASLQLWRRFFGDGAVIVGIDIDESCTAFNAPQHDIHVEIGDQSDAAFLQSVVDKYGPFDIIIDDGSHVASHQIASFNALFNNGLKETGIYFVEDLECMYWGHTDVYRDASVTAVEFFKMLIDIQNSIFEDYGYSDFAVHSADSRTQYDVIALAKSIASIKFGRGLVVVEKAPQMPPQVLHL
ncbi:class I SAM-dependent methyltransferase [Agrobacterium sp. lyk4-40-TYG-31]|uniref:class I SAM-dependent methyltransferase n=1 Tax=Agrobacterium sp. lyk4-40-TYG-31 TaxID=3040276 RepID=UPI002550E05A|nr:class I SAM-dependent methyltransferase [Agrobacterium sp. lyk4-40-TYG-31]